MRVIETKVYTFDELDEKAKEKARDWWRAGNDFPMLGSHLVNMAKEYMDEIGIEYDEDSVDVFYSLAYCQGDGAMIVGNLRWKGHDIIVTHAHRQYCHAYTAGFNADTMTGDELKEFQSVYVGLCIKVERAGYDDMEYQNSPECVDECLITNKYTFTADGKRFG